MIAKIIIGLVALVAIFLVIAATRPADFHFERTTAISAPPAAAFAYVNDLHLWQKMSPYASLDPAAKYTFAGPESGLGASMAWTGNSKVGQGSITIVESRPGEFVRMKLEFLKPFKSTNTAEFTFKRGGEQTVATWAMYGQNNLMSKAMGLILNMDKMIGGQFEQGLANLKSLAEADARKP